MRPEVGCACGQISRQQQTYQNFTALFSYKRRRFHQSTNIYLVWLPDHIALKRWNASSVNGCSLRSTNSDSSNVAFGGSGLRPKARHSKTQKRPLRGASYACSVGKNHRPQVRTVPQSMWTKFDPEYWPTPPPRHTAAALAIWPTLRELNPRSAA